MNTTPSLREQISDAIVRTLTTMEYPRARLVTREPFDISKIAITDFPAILVQLDVEERNLMTMGIPGVGRRTGDMLFTIRGYVRGTELDKQRNELITGIETILDNDRYVGLQALGVTTSNILKIEIINRAPPLAEIRIEFQIQYNYIRTQP
jgi:hypothetical protein